MRRSLAALAALTMSAPSLAAAQAAPSTEPLADRLEQRLLECPTQATFTGLTRRADNVQMFGWNCRGVSPIPLEGVEHTAMLSQGQAPGAARTLQVAVITADGQSVCYAARHFAPPRPTDDGRVSIQHVTTFGYATLAEFARPDFTPTLTNDLSTVAASAGCRDAVVQDLEVITRVLTTPVRRTPPQSNAPIVNANEV